MPPGSSAGGRDRRRPAQVGKRGLTTQPLGVIAGGDQQLPGVLDADRQQAQGSRCGLGDQLAQPLVGELDLLLQGQDAHRHRAQRCLGRLGRVGQLGKVGRSRAQAATCRAVDHPSSGSRTTAGAVTTTALSWLIAAVRALTAPARTPRSTRIASTIPSRRLGSAVAVPANTARAAASASTGSLLPRRRRVVRLGRSASSTCTPRSSRNRVSPAP